MIMALLTISVSAMFFTACSSDDNGDGNTEIKGDYIATTDVKTVVFKEYHDYKKGTVLIYEDFNHKYALGLYRGRVTLVSYYRDAGSWHLGLSDSGHWGNVSIKDLGKVSSITDVVEKVYDHWESSYVQPWHGYAAWFITDNDKEFLRIYISDYKLDGDGALESITVEYQQY